MRNNNYQIDYTQKTIIVTKRFLKEAGIIGSTAYTELASVRNDLPDFKVVQREISKKQGKKTYAAATSLSAKAATGLADLTETEYGLQLLTLLREHNRPMYIR